MSPARIYLIASGIFLVLAAVGGFIVDASFPIGSGEVRQAGSGHLFGVFETNGWHSLAALLSGAVALAFAANPQWARLGALVKGWFYVGVTLSIMVFGAETFWIASNTADQVVHATLGVVGVVTGYSTARADRVVSPARA